MPLMAFFPGFQFRKARWGVDRDRQVRDRRWWAPTGAYSLFTNLRFPSSCCSSFSFVSFYLFPPASELYRWEQKISVEVLLSGDSFNVGFGICYCDLLVFTLVKIACDLYLCCRICNHVWSTFKGRDDYCHIVGQFLSENSRSWKQSDGHSTSAWWRHGYMSSEIYADMSRCPES